MGLFDDILDTTVKVAGVTLSVAGGVAVNTVRGAAAAVGDAQEIVSGLTRLDLTPIENVAERRISGAVSGIESQVKTAATLLDELGACAMDSDRPFLTDENTERLTSLATAGLVVAAGGSLVSLQSSRMTWGLTVGMKRLAASSLLTSLRSRPKTACLMATAATYRL